MFSELAPSACAALSLARLAIEPLLEYCSLWKGVDSSGTFGYEAMYLKLHPLQVSSSCIDVRLRLRLRRIVLSRVGHDQKREKDASPSPRNESRPSRE
jgi:hypothetical protein